MPGHIRKRDDKGKRKDGTTKWEAVWRNPLNQAQSRSKTFRNKAIATRWLQEQDTNAYAGTYVDPRKSDRPLHQVADEWQDTWLDLAPKTKAGYAHVLAKHILPSFGKYKVGALQPDAIQTWVSQLAKTRQPNTVRNIVAVLKGLLKFAVQRRYIVVDPTSAVRLPKANKNKRPQLYLTPSEISELAQTLPAPYDTAVYVAAYSGLRAGELWALRREDIDLLQGTITVTRAFKEIYGASAAASEHGLLIGTPKSDASNRVVSIPGPVKSLLIEYLARGVHCGGTGREALVFTTANGFPVRHGRFYGKVFRPAVAALWSEGHRLHRLRFHDMRHTCAALSLAVTPNLHVVKQRLGHESITTTIDTYGHLLPSVDAALMDGLAELFNSAQTPPDNVRALRALDGSDASS